MRKLSAPLFALLGTLLLILLCIMGRLVFIGYHTTSYEKIAGKNTPESLVLSENNMELRVVTDPAELADITELLSSYTYTEYPHLLHPSEEKQVGNLLTVTFVNQNSISVNANGYVFLNGKLRDIEGSRGQEFYHKLYILFYPGTAK